MDAYTNCIQKELKRARLVPITYLNHAGSTIALFRADMFEAGVKQAIGRCLVANAIDTGQINGHTCAVVIHGAGNTVSAVKAGIDELGLCVKVVAVIYRETSPHIWQRLERHGIEVVAETPRTNGRGGRIETVSQLCETNHGYVLLEQHETELIVDIQRKTFGLRIAEEVRSTHFVAGVGTGGTLFGIGQALRDTNQKTQLIGVEGVGSTLTLWHAYLHVSDQNFNVKKRAIEIALKKYRTAGMLTELICHPNNEPDEWFEINIDFPDTITGTVGIEGLGVGDPTQMIMNRLPTLNSCRIVTDEQMRQGQQALETHGILAFESAGANFFAAMQLAEELQQQNQHGVITTVVTAMAGGQ